MELITRAEAKALGRKRYYTGEPCKHGHDSERQTSSGTCIDCSILAVHRYRGGSDTRPPRRSRAISDARAQREEARAAGIKTYQGRPCKHGHDAERYTRNGACVECTRAHQIKWARENPDKVRESIAKWTRENSERVKAYQAEWARENPEKHREATRRYRAKHPDRAKASSRRTRANNLAKFRERDRLAQARYRAENPGKVKAIDARKRAANLGRLPVWLTDQDWAVMADIYESCPDGWHVDHIVPLQGTNVSGLHVPWNLQHLPAEENLTKHNKFDPDDDLPPVIIENIPAHAAPAMF